MNYVVLSEKEWNSSMHLSLEKKINGVWTLISNRSDFNVEQLTLIDPDKIFIPHWSYIIPKEIFQKFECIVFHMTDLPYGRGGSPLQNLIVRGHKKTKISALRVVEKVDAGDIYLKKDMSLDGTAEDILYRAAGIIESMIIEIVAQKIMPLPQVGKPTYFKRRKPEESDMIELENLNNVYNYIRMLDAEGYSKAFLETEHLSFDFSGVKKHSNYLTAYVRIIKK